MSKRIPIGVLFGITPNFQVSQTPKAPVDKLKLKGNDLTVDIGLNYSIKIRSLIFQPEIRYSKSLVNVAGTTGQNMVRESPAFTGTRLQSAFTSDNDGTKSSYGSQQSAYASLGQSVSLK